MPELPDIELYRERVEALAAKRRLVEVRLGSPFLLRSVEPPLEKFVDRRLQELRRIGKRIAFGFEGDLWLVLHLMIAGRLHWYPSGKKAPAKSPLLTLEFESGTLTLTEAGSKRRAALHAVSSRDDLALFDRGGIDPLTSSPAEMRQALTRENRTLKRALTDPRLISGIGNAYSDEILHHARLSPFRLTSQLDAREWEQLQRSTRTVLSEATALRRAECGDHFPEKVTAFHPEFAVHGRFGNLCPRCGTPVQRIRYADNECNYCVTCQTGGRLLADRGLSQLLRSDWPKTLEELEELKQRHRLQTDP